MYQTYIRSSESINRKYRMNEDRRARLRMVVGVEYNARAEFKGGKRQGEWFGINQYWPSVNSRNEDPSVNLLYSLRI